MFYFLRLSRIEIQFYLPTRKRQDGDIPVVSSSGISGYHNEAKVKAPGVVTGRYGTLGEVFYISKDFWPLNTTLYIRDFKGNDPKFISYFLQTLNLAHQNAAGAVPGLNRNALHLLPVKCPPFPIQRKIAVILSAYDDLIENNTRRIEILEEMARSLYHQWFVNFRFPGHEQVKMVDSELGLIPEGWEVKKLSTLVGTQYSYTASASEVEVGFKYLRGKDINKASYIQRDSVPYCPINGAEYQKYKLNVKDILIIRMADPGKVGIVEKEINAVFASYLIRLNITSPQLLPYYLFYFLSSDYYQDFITGASTGTTRKSASAGVITDISIIIPSRKISQQFEYQISAIRKMLNNLLDKNSNLRQTRNLLLPRLISGKIDLEEIDIEVYNAENN
jgi:type I restriction enzyme S subunit